MANIQNIPVSEKLIESNPKINQNFQNLNAELTGHINSKSAHKAENITYSGDAPGINVKQAIDNMDTRIDNIVSQSGDDITEIVDARGGYPVLGDRLNAIDENFLVSPLNYGAVGDGLSNDTAAFTGLELVNNGLSINLLGKTYVVDAIPTKNAYFNGVFKLGINTRPALLSNYSLTDGTPKFHKIGGQLSKLKQSLLNPLEQFVGIVFIGDSITWGSGLGTENSVSSPRDGTLSDPRDNFSNPSFVNNFKRYIGRLYADNSVPTLTNWAASPSGESTATYGLRHILYPKDGDFTVTTSGASTTITEVQSSATLSGFQLRLEDFNNDGSSSLSIKFPFTGSSFTLSFGVVEADATFYELIVDGVNKGTFSNHVGVDGFVQGSDQRRTHTFDYVRNKIVEIRTKRNGEIGPRRLRVEAIIIDKKIRITNQGIIGSSARVYRSLNLSGNTQGDGVAVGTEDNYVFCQLGTNDRGIHSATPKGSNQFKINLKSTIDAITPLAELILMCANPAANEDPASFSFNMSQVRGVIYNLAKSNSLDMIDNYAIWSGIDINTLASDGLHPNNIGHQMIARNIINSLESC